MKKRAMTFPPVWKDFRFDERGDLVTPCGYKCHPNLLETALWLFEANSLTIGQRPIYSDEQVGAAQSARRTITEPAVEPWEETSEQLEQAHHAEQPGNEKNEAEEGHHGNISRASGNIGI